MRNYRRVTININLEKTPTQIKTYYFKTLPKRGWTADENVKLIDSVKKYQKVPNIWEAVAQEFPGRTPDLIRQHYEVTLGRIARKKIKKEKEDGDDYI